MNNIGEMLTKAVEGVTRQFNAQVEASIAMLVNSGIPLERIELIHRTTEDMSVVTEVRSRTSDEAQAAAIEREATSAFLERVANYATHPMVGEGGEWRRVVSDTELKAIARAIRNGDHLKEEA